MCRKWCDSVLREREKQRAAAAAAGLFVCAKVHVRHVLLSYPLVVESNVCVCEGEFV